MKKLMFGSNWIAGWKLILHACAAFQRYPVLIVPIVTTWLIYAPSIVYLRYFYPWRYHTGLENIGVVFLTILVWSFMITLSCTMLLEMIRQIEQGKPSLAKAVVRTLSQDAIRVLPLAIIWAFLWFFLTILEGIFSKNRNSGTEAFNAENVAATLADYRQFSLSGAFFQALEKGVRMVVFLILPSIVWENMGLLEGMKKGLIVLKTHLGNFASGYALTYAAAGIIFLPPAIIFELGTGRHHNPPIIHFPDSVWMGTIIYIGLTWSFTMYLEQMFTAQLYLWHLRWEKAVENARNANQPLPAFDEVKAPVLLDVTTL